MQIHPSVIMSISEHHIRTRAIKPDHDPVIGALLGKKTDRGAEIIDSFELRYAADYIDVEFYQKKIPLVKQVSPDLDLVGWYSTTDLDISLHKQINELMPNPIFLKLNPYRRENDPKISGVLPLNVYEPVIEVDDAGEHLDLIEVSWTIVTEDVEIIGLEHNAKMTHADIAPSAAIDNLRMQHSAVKMLKDRIKAISKFVKDVQAGTLPFDEEVMLDIARLCNRFPLMSSPEYALAYNIKCNDVALNTYLGILTKGSMCKMHSGVQGLKTRAFPSTHARR